MGKNMAAVHFNTIPMRALHSPCSTRKAIFLHFFVPVLTTLCMPDLKASEHLSTFSEGLFKFSCAKSYA